MDDWALKNQLSIYLHTYGSTHIGYIHQIDIPHLQATNTCSCTETFAAHTCTHTSYSNVICVIVQNLFTCTVTIEVTIKRFHVLHPSSRLRATETSLCNVTKPAYSWDLSLWHGLVCSWDLSLWHGLVCSWDLASALTWASVLLRPFTLTWVSVLLRPFTLTWVSVLLRPFTLTWVSVLLGPFTLT